MKLLIAVVHGEDASATMDALNDRGISVTRFASSGGFLQHKNVTLMTGIDDDRIEEVLGLIKENCRTRSEFMNPMPPLVERHELTARSTGKEPNRRLRIYTTAD